MINIRVAGHAEIVGERRAGQHAEYGNRAVPVAFSGQNELAERASAQKNSAPADRCHPEQVPQIIMMGNRLHGKRGMESAQQQVADQHGGEDRRKAAH